MRPAFERGVPSFPAATVAVGVTFAAMSSTILYGYWRSSASYRVRIALAWKGIAYTYVPVNLLDGEQRSEAHLARNPMGYVPAVEVDGELFTESLAIFELLDGLHPESPRLFSAEPRRRARQLAACHTIASGIQPLQNLSVLGKLPLDAEGKKAWAQHFISHGFAALERQLQAESGATGFAMGDEFSAVDACIVPQIYAAKRFDVDLAPYPRILRAYETAGSLAAVAGAAPEKQIDAKL
jgi:maleylpyruvate isomerase